MRACALPALKLPRRATSSASVNASGCEGESPGAGVLGAGVLGAVDEEEEPDAPEAVEVAREFPVAAPEIPVAAPEIPVAAPVDAVAAPVVADEAPRVPVGTSVDGPVGEDEPAATGAGVWAREDGASRERAARATPGENRIIPDRWRYAARKLTSHLKPLAAGR
jgi:hypothetical protein